MPLYEYQCAACDQRFEVIHKYSDPPVEVCTKCGKGPVQRLMSSPAIQFKGTGWYITDYAQKGKSGGASGGGKGGSDSKTAEGGGSDSGGGDSGKTEKSDAPAATAAPAASTTPAKE